MNSRPTLSRWYKVALAGLALAGMTAFVTPTIVHAADSTTTKPAAKLPDLPPEVKETAPEPTLALVDGIPIDREKFNSLLMAIGGPRLFEQVVTYVLAQEACDKAGVKIEPADVEAEKTGILTGLGQQYPDLKAADRERALGVLLQKQGITGMEFQLSLQRAACLRALAKGKSVPTSDDIEQAWKADNAEKADILDIVVPDFKAAAEVRTYVENNKKAPVELIQSKKYGAQQFQISYAVPQTGAGKDLKEMVFGNGPGEGLKEGELSAARMIGATEGKPGELHVLYCLKRIPATNKTMSSSDRADLEKKMTEAYESRWAEAHLRKLTAEAHIDIKDKTLSAYYQALNEQNRRAATQAATQPAK